MAYHISKGMTKTSPLVTFSSILDIFRKYRQITVYILITCVVGVNVYVNNSTCVTDVERVPYCPATEEKWRMAAERKNCSSKIPECPYTDPLKYHCLINAWRNETYELCGVDTEIIGFSCAEYNAGGKKIQPNYASRCEYFDPGCPFKYNSSTGYFYPKCYQILQNDHIVVEALSTRQPDDTTVVNVTSAQPDDTTVVNVTTSPSEDET
ncbi:uncharacterized protein LOC125677560 isoform X2 [Ostrea edulis]|nr:uncharacterized protein LOC125677560 isoform X2 [Ostrea edulis]